MKLIIANNVNWKIARIQMAARKKQAIVAILGVTFGVSMFITLMSFMKGVNHFLLDVVTSATPDIHLYADQVKTMPFPVPSELQKDAQKMISFEYGRKPRGQEKNFSNAGVLLNALRFDPAVEAVSPVVTLQAFLRHGSSIANAQILGVSVGDAESVLKLSSKLTSGSIRDMEISENGIILGSGLAERLKVHLGDWMTISTANGVKDRIRVCSIIRYGLGSIDNSRAFIHIRRIRQWLGRGNDFTTGYFIRLKDPEFSEVSAFTFSRRYGYRADTRAQSNGYYLTIIFVQDMMTYIVSLAILLVAGFGIYNIMNMIINGKLNDIAILKAEGFSGKDIRQIFLSQAVFVGVIGASIGVLFGIIFTSLISTIPIPRSDLTSIPYFPVRFDPLYCLWGFLFGIVCSFLAGLMPAIRASKMDPLSILRR
jgi:lipoprotein-releasing system permease protein